MLWSVRDKFGNAWRPSWGFRSKPWTGMEAVVVLIDKRVGKHLLWRVSVERGDGEWVEKSG